METSVEEAKHAKQNEDPQHVSDSLQQIEPREDIKITRKDPRRVEQGRRLAAISKAAKEKKMRQKILEEQSIQSQQSQQSEVSSSFFTLPVFVGVASLSFGLFLLFWKHSKSEVKIETCKEEVQNEVYEAKHACVQSETTKTPSTPSVPVYKKKFETLD